MLTGTDYFALVHFLRTDDWPVVAVKLLQVPGYQR
jgi:hypothetical protein